MFSVCVTRAGLETGPCSRRAQGRPRLTQLNCYKMQPRLQPPVAHKHLCTSLHIKAPPCTLYNTTAQTHKHSGRHVKTTPPLDSGCTSNGSQPRRVCFLVQKQLFLLPQCCTLMESFQTWLKCYFSFRRASDALCNPLDKSYDCVDGCSAGRLRPPLPRQPRSAGYCYSAAAGPSAATRE